MKNPVRIKQGIKCGDVVESLVSRRDPYLYPGKLGEVSRIRGSKYLIILSCGCSWYAGKNQIKKVSRSLLTEEKEAYNKLFVEGKLI